MTIVEWKTKLKVLYAAVEIVIALVSASVGGLVCCVGHNHGIKVRRLNLSGLLLQLVCFSFRNDKLLLTVECHLGQF